MTKYSKQILELINQSNGHMTAEQLFMELKKRNPELFRQLCIII